MRSRHDAGSDGGDEVLAKRVIRYLKKHPRLIVYYPWQADVDEITIYTD